METNLQIAVSATASFFGFTLILALTVIICKVVQHRRRSRLWGRNLHAPTQSANGSPAARSDPIDVGESTKFDPSLDPISMPELLRATCNFSPDLIIGDGGFGLVYKARLSSGAIVAVKRLSPDAFQGFREFRAEVETLGRIRHKNIVKILGYYSSGWERILVYDFVEKGSLDQWLYDTSPWENGDKRLPLPWPTRVNVMKGVAMGLAYMHNLDVPIIHRDIKASNVLLDNEFEAHIADFGLARKVEGSHLHVSTQVAGTMGYMPPEYIHGAPRATMMGDVYSYGMLMLEVVTACRPNWPFCGEDGKEMRLIDWVRGMVQQNRYMEMVDSSMPMDVLKECSVVEYFRIAGLCTHEMHTCRPRMDEVVSLLDGVPI